MNELPLNPDVDVAMFAAMVGGQLRQVDKSMEKLSSTGAAAKINPYDFLPNRGPVSRQPSLAAPADSTRWYSPDESQVQSSVPYENIMPTGAFVDPVESSIGTPKLVPAPVRAPSAQLPQRVSSPRSDKQPTSLTREEDLSKVLKSIDKTLKLINKTMRQIWLESSTQSDNDLNPTS